MTRPSRPIWRPIALPIALVAACAAKSDREASPEAVTVAAEPAPAVRAGAADSALRAEKQSEVQTAGMLKFRADKDGGGGAPAAPAAARTAPGAGATTPEGPTRSWFPETFLFEPLVVTDDRGAAVVPVRVPDRLTTWRVLALAHSRTGAQGGAVTSFLGTLPTYVDPVVPPFLIQGDEVRVPIQVVNTTSAEVTGALEVSATGATLRRAARPAGPLRVPAQGSALDHATLSADQPGRVTLRVALAGGDAVERSFEVRPAGRPVTQTRSGTLAAPRSFQTAGTPGADPATDRVHLLVFPG
ncbi:MAG TPA: alpha-2-macroglobulin family protein, partial [Kofleriaceae bacterium]|nr:alpha-2-macroglobulin family protein [Kofleriaceae bacterium]